MMKLSGGFQKFWPSLFIFVLYGISLAFMTYALRQMDVSFVYAVWSGVGTLAITIVGIMFFDEPGTLLKYLSIALIVIGVVGLNLAE